MKQTPMRLLLASLVLGTWSLGIMAGEGPEPLIEKLQPISMAELAKRTNDRRSISRRSERLCARSLHWCDDA